MFSHIGELRAIRSDVPIAALTATSAPSQRRKIMKSLCFRQSSVIISESPDRENIKITSLCIPNNCEIEDAFGWLITEFNKQKEKLPRHIIFSESISDVAKLYAIFRKRVGKSCMFEMFHSKTVESKKESIRADMSKKGEIRILMCTNSAGMGVNFADVHNIIHYGLPREMDVLVQQMGRAGRDGVFSNELIIYKCHKGHLKQVEDELVRMVKDTKCRRQVLCSSYGTNVKKVEPLHMCCDICEKLCKCDNTNCPETHPALQFKMVGMESESMKRSVNDREKTAVRQRLHALKFRLSDFSTVVNPDLVHGLSDGVIDHIADHVEHLFTPEDILRSCAVWSYDVSVQISDIINDVFGDSIMYDINDSDFDNDEYEDDA